MSSKVSTAAKPATSTAAKPALQVAPKPRKPRTPGMTLAQKFAVLKVVEAADPTTADAALAESLTVSTGRTITAAQIKGYRKELNIASVGRPKAAELLVMLERANARIKELELSGADLSGANLSGANLSWAKAQLV